MVFDAVVEVCGVSVVDGISVVTSNVVSSGGSTVVVMSTRDRESVNRNDNNAINMKCVKAIVSGDYFDAVLKDWNQVIAIQSLWRNLGIEPGMIKKKNFKF